MPAACAVCRQPITKQSKFRVVETEAVHEGCLGQLQRSLVTRLRQRIVLHRDEASRLRQLYQEAQSVAEAAKRELHHVRREIELSQTEAQRLRDEVGQLHRSMVEKDAAATKLYNRLHLAERDRDGFLAELEQSRRDNAALRSELALRQTLSQAPAPPVATTPDPAPAKDDRHPSEIRFSLLEIDKP